VNKARGWPADPGCGTEPSGFQQRPRFPLCAFAQSKRHNAVACYGEIFEGSEGPMAIY